MFPILLPPKSIAKLPLIPKGAVGDLVPGQ